MHNLEFLRSEQINFSIDPLNEPVITVEEFSKITNLEGNAFEEKIQFILKAAQIDVEKEYRTLFSRRCIKVSVPFYKSGGQVIISLPASPLEEIVALSFEKITNNLMEKKKISPDKIEEFIEPINNSQILLKKIPKNYVPHFEFMCFTLPDELIKVKIIKKARDLWYQNLF